MNWTGKTEIGYHVTPQAKADLIKIGQFTEVQWGKAQRNRYLKSLENRFAWLAGNPLVGKHRIDIAQGYYSFPHGQHVVFYLIAGEMIAIIGVPHQEMDVIAYFNTDA